MRHEGCGAVQEENVIAYQSRVLLCASTLEGIEGCIVRED